MTQGPIWEKPLRMKLAFLCMAAVAGKEGDLSACTEDIIYFARNLSGCDDAPPVVRHDGYDGSYAVGEDTKR